MKFKDIAFFSIPTVAMFATLGWQMQYGEKCTEETELFCSESQNSWQD